MSRAVQTKDLDFVELSNHVKYAADYYDMHQSRWSITIAGTQSLAEEFAERRAFAVVAVPQSAKPVFPPVDEEYVDDEANDDNGREDRLPFNLPDLEVDFTLVDTSIDGDMRIEFYIDPKIKAGSSHTYSFTLGSNDTRANVNYSADGMVSVTLHGASDSASSRGKSGSVSKKGDPASKWQLIIGNYSKSDVNYNLRGDLWA